MFSQGAGLRLLIISLAILIGLQITIVGASVFIRAKELGSPLQPLLIRQTVAAVALIEKTPQDDRGAAIAAINSPFIRYRLIQRFPQSSFPGEPLASFRPIISAYETALRGREFRVYKRESFRRRLLKARRSFIPGNLIIVIKLDYGALVVEPFPNYRRQALFNFAAFLSSIIGVALLAGLVWASLGATRPVQRMTAAAEKLASDLNAPPIVESGPEPVRRLAGAFNKMQADLKKLVNQRTITLAAVAHDFRTYLTRLRVRAEYIEDEAQRAKAVMDIEEMTALIDDTLMVAKADGERAHVETVDLRALLNEILTAQLEMNRDVAFEAPPTPAIARASRAGAKRAITNVVDNAVRYGGRARVEVSHSAEMIDIRVSDEGPGVPEADIQRLADPFFRVDTSRSRMTGGSGLGLAIAQSLVEASGGRIAFRNAPARGLEVTISFPRALESDSQPVPQA